MTDTTAASPQRRMQWGAIGAGVLGFVALYILLALLILFALALASEHLPTAVLYGGFKAAGLITWGLPGYIAGRVAGYRGWLHGTVTGLVVGLLVALSLTFTFSWEGTVHDAVRDSMVKSFVIAWGLCTLGGTLADLLALRRRARVPS